jgi:hypothetical protein
MAWREARAQIAAILAAIYITDPVVLAIKRVYTTPPATVQDVPCFIIIPPALKVERGASGLRIKTYTVRIRCLVSDEALDRAHDLVDAFREAIVDAFDSDITLNHTVTQIVGPNVEEAGGAKYGSIAYSGMDCLLTVQIQEARNFS